ncbi:multimerin-1-like [Mya arenaria]|uniref:multimerin-1-like n=1 Tax=Mya arenaria TaxID=6604 RepID=UPI0022E7CE1A|nr:multimerin-1-like [Mya arenaria]
MQSRMETITKTNQALNIRLNKLEKLNGDTQKYMDVSIAAGNNSYPTETTVETEGLKTKPNRSALSRINRIPGEVAFHAYMSATKCIGSHEVFIFDVEMTDLGGAYNNRDGIFDVPVAGIYVFTFTIYSDYSHEVRAELIIDGQVKSVLLADADEVNDYHTGTATVVVQVNAGDHVFVRRADSYSECNVLSTFSRALTTFSGWLLY